jgi:hypothetical protein
MEEIINTYKMLSEYPKIRYHLGYVGADGKITFKMFLNVVLLSCWDVCWIPVAGDGDRWPVLLTTVMNLRVP